MAQKTLQDVVHEQILEGKTGAAKRGFSPGRSSQLKFPLVTRMSWRGLQSNHHSQPRWDRFERADLFEQYRALRTQGISERQAAKELKVPRTTLQAWRMWHDTLDSCPCVAAFFQSGPGLAFLHRLVIAFHLVCVEVGACGIRLVCLFLHLTGLDRCVAASYGAQQQVNVQVEHAMVT